MFTTKLVVLIGFVVLVGFGPADLKFLFLFGEGEFQKAPDPLQPFS